MAAFKRRLYSARGISMTPNCVRCGLVNWVSSSVKPCFHRRAVKYTSAILLASSRQENMLSPKNAPPMETP
ncbi:MAG: hypothetical protein PW788_10915 [Micavibrio sp.]|nr:hypothetical protein [Micavibrio sp.]